jgi:hypothetical protein
MLSLKALASAGSALLIAGCASAPAPDYPIDHPANPAAAVAPATPQPSALASYRSPQPAPAAGATPAPDSQQSQKKEDPHAGHR